MNVLDRFLARRHPTPVTAQSDVHADRAEIEQRRRDLAIALGQLEIQVEAERLARVARVSRRRQTRRGQQT